MIWTPVVTHLILPPYDMMADDDSEIWASGNRFVFAYKGDLVLADTIVASFQFSGAENGNLYADFNCLNGKGTYNERPDGGGMSMFWSNRHNCWCIMLQIPASGEPLETTDDEGNVTGDKYWTAANLPANGETVTFGPAGKAEAEIELQCVWNLAFYESNTRGDDQYPAGKYDYDDGGTVTIGKRNPEDGKYYMKTTATTRYLFEVATWK